MPESRHRRRRGRALPRASRSAGTLAASTPKKKKTNKLYFIASAVIAVLVIAGFMIPTFIGGGGGTSDSLPIGSSDQYVEGVGVRHEIMREYYSRPHVLDSETVSYSTAPPTSGQHWNDWAECGFYTEGLPDERTTHNLEHGVIVVSYNLSSEEEVAQLRSAVEGIDLYQDWGLTRFYDKIPEGTVALATWGVSDTIEGIDPDRMDKFFSTYAGNLGPEVIPCGFGNLGSMG